MKSRFLAALIGAGLSVPALAVDPLYQNFGIVTNPPQIDAEIFINRGTFTNFFTTLPFDTQNTRHFTNFGTMVGSVGWRFDRATETHRFPADTFFNRGTITALDSGLGFLGIARVGEGFFFAGSGSAGSHVNVSATNVVNSGELLVGEVGLLRVQGRNVDLSRGALAAGGVASVDTNQFFFGGFFFQNVNRGFIFGNSYANAIGVEDLYWGAGAEEYVLPTMAARLFFGPPPFNSVVSPPHLVQLREAFFMTTSLPRSFPAEFEMHADLRPAFLFDENEPPFPASTNLVYSLVFVRTNFADTNITAQVRFGPALVPAGLNDPNGSGSSIIEFSTTEQDPITGGIATNAIYLLDHAASHNSIVLFTNITTPNSQGRPSNYEIATAMPVEWLFAREGNYTEFHDPDLVYPGILDSPGFGVYTSRTADGFFGAYAAQVGRNPETASGRTFTGQFGFFNFFGTQFLRLPDPTNQPGRIEIKADELEMTHARIRAEGVLSMDVKHLKGGGAAAVNAGIIQANLASTNGSMVVSNVFPATFKRVRGDIFAWTGTWRVVGTNDFRTNTIKFHVTIVDHDLKADFQPTIRDLTLTAGNLVIQDDLRISRNARFDTESLTIISTEERPAGITLVEDARNLTAATLGDLRHFALLGTNSFFSVESAAFFGFDHPQGLLGFTNQGTIGPGALLVKSRFIENSGDIVTENGADVFLTGGTADLSDGRIIADGTVSLSLNNLITSNTVIVAGATGGFGQLLLDLTNSVSDGGAGASNLWQVTDGVVMSRKPAFGDLLGTTLHSTVRSFAESRHVWAGVNRGANPSGYVNNVALGRLILDRSTNQLNSVFRFTGATFNNALYVDFLEFTNFTSRAEIGEMLSVDSNMVLYFADSNVAIEDITALFPDGEVRWVGFAGPNSSVNVTLASGQTISVNRILAESESFDGVQLASTSPLVLETLGQGTVKPNLHGRLLQVGKHYQVTAAPAAGQVFGGWFGSGIASSAPSLVFPMEPDMVLLASFVPSPFGELGGGYHGLFYETDNVLHESSGFSAFSVTAKGRFSGRLVMGRERLPVRGQFNADGESEVSVKRRGKPSLTLNLKLDLESEAGRITGTVRGGNSWESELKAYRTINRNGPVHAGRHTMVIPGGEEPWVAPAGHSYGSVLVTPAGQLRFNGALSDGVRAVQTTALTHDGQWPLYVPLYKGAGSLVGWVTNAPSPGSFTGEVTWTKTAAVGKFYRQGFYRRTPLLASRYIAPAKGSPVLDLTDGSVTLSGGNLTETLAGSVTVASNHSATVSGFANPVSLRFSPGSGLMTGKFVHPETRRMTQIKGIILQQQNTAHGFFLGTSQSGAVVLEQP